MGNKDTVILDLDRPRELRLTHRAMKRFAAKTHCKLTDLQNAIDDYDKLTALLHVMLSEEDKELTPERLDELIDEAERREGSPLRIGDLIEAVADAVAIAFGPEKAKDTAAPDPPLKSGASAEA